MTGKRSNSVRVLKHANTGACNSSGTYKDQNQIINNTKYSLFVVFGYENDKID